MYHNLSWSCWQIAFFVQLSSDQSVDRAYSGLWHFLHTRWDHSCGMVACGVVAPEVEGRDDGAPGIHWDPQSSDAQAGVDLLGVMCVDVALGLVSARGRTPWVKVQQG